MNAEQAGAAGPEPMAVDAPGEDQARELHDDPRIPSRAELDDLFERGPAKGWTEQTARAWEYLDARREIADERAAAVERGDTETVARLDRHHALLDHNYLGLARGLPVADDSATDAGRVDAGPVDAGPVDAAPTAAVADHMPVGGPPVGGGTQDPRPEPSSVPDDPARLRTRIAALQAQRAGASSSNDQARRAQLAAWADDDTQLHCEIGPRSAAGDGRDSSDEDGA